MVRSNRTLTQFAVDKLIQFERNEWKGSLQQSKGNTTVGIHVSEATGPRGLAIRPTFQVFLFGQAIFEMDDQHIVVRAGNFFDSKGRLTRTTRERLNGLLDAAGELGLIPQGVRAFLGEENGEEASFVGRDGTVFRLDRSHPDLVIALSREELKVF